MAIPFLRSFAAAIYGSGQWLVLEKRLDAFVAAVIEFSSLPLGHQPLLITEASVSSNPENQLFPLVHFSHSPRSSHRFDAGPGCLKLQLQAFEPG